MFRWRVLRTLHGRGSTSLSQAQHVQGHLVLQQTGQLITSIWWMISGAKSFIGVTQWAPGSGLGPFFGVSMKMPTTAPEVLTLCPWCTPHTLVPLGLRRLDSKILWIGCHFCFGVNWFFLCRQVCSCLCSTMSPWRQLASLKAWMFGKGSFVTTCPKNYWSQEKSYLELPFRTMLDEALLQHLNVFF